jgi:hypothetical protein
MLPHGVHEYGHIPVDTFPFAQLLTVLTPVGVVTAASPVVSGTRIYFPGLSR